MFPRIDKGPIEYDLQIGMAWNVEKKRKCLRFLFHTTEEFHHFQYEIAVDHEIDDERMLFHLRGLKTRGMGMPGVGHAEKVIDLFDVDGTYTVTIAKPGDIRNDCEIRVVRDSIKLTRPVSDPGAFVTVSIV